MAVFRNVKALAAFFMCGLMFWSSAIAAPVQISANTRVYIETQEEIIGKKKKTPEGKVVRAKVWRDVVVDGVTIIKAGTPALVRVDKVKNSKVAGIKGKLTLGAYETTLVNGDPIQLGGGYYKEGKGRIALSATLAAVVFLPLIFIKGKKAKLPSGTIFDAYIDYSTTAEINAEPARKLKLSGIGGPSVDAVVIYDELEAMEKPKDFPFSITAPVESEGVFTIDSVNNKTIDAIELEASETGEEGVWRATTGIKNLSKHFKKGINTFEISTEIAGERLADEVVLDIQI